MSSADTALIRDVSEGEFDRLVIERSREVPVVVDLWAEWCAPCRALGPALERAVEDRAGGVELAKVDVDSNQALAACYSVQGIPAVKAFRDGEVAAEFTGALPPAEVERFLDELIPSEALELAEPLADTDFIAAGLAARARLELAGQAPREAFEAWDDGDHERALELLQEEVATADADRREELRRVMVARG